MRRPPAAARAAAIGALIVACCLAVAACGSTSARSGRVVRPDRSLPPSPLATSLETASGTWVTVPMGHPRQALSVFWQLFVRRPGSLLWVDVTSFAVATNGGIVLASNGAGSLLVGVRATNRLSYSPLATTASAGKSWSALTPVGALAPRTDAIAASGPDELALIGANDGGRVAAATGSRRWTTLTTEAAIAAAPAARGCGVTGLTAVAFGGGGDLIGLGCSRPGVTGILSYRNGSWRLDGPRLPAPLASGDVEVASLTGRRTGATALLEVSGRFGVRLVTASLSSAASGRWRLSAPLPLPAGARLLSFGPAGDGLFVLSSNRRHEQLDVAGGPGAGWSALPAPPGGTVTASFGPKGAVDAFVPRGSVLTVWSLAGSRRWAKSEVLNVPIQYGSSG